MLFQRIESEGIAQYSYLVGDSHEAVVIDPRRDIDVYLEAATLQGYRIVAVLETHRHEDFVLGSVELAARTGAEIWHADGQWDYRYGQAAEDGQTWKIGRLKLEAVSSPGHTPGSMSYLLYESSGNPWMLFTGDALFAGDVGRVDFLGEDQMARMAGLLYDTLHRRLLPFGDEVIVCPGHGAGSVCAADIADRSWTTIGLERRYNPKLQFPDRDAFILGVARKLEYAPYFRQMERLNLEGPPLLGAMPLPKPLSAAAFASQLQASIVVDTRMELGFGASHVPGSLSIWLGGLPGYAGWFLPYGIPILLVQEGEDFSQTLRYLIRFGYDTVAGHLAGGMLSWNTAGYESGSIRMVSSPSLCRLLDEGEQAWILDIRSEDEVATHGSISGAHNIHLTMLPERMNEVPKGGTVYILCASDLRSMIAASLLRRAGWRNAVVVLGGLIGWNSTTCPIV